LRRLWRPLLAGVSVFLAQSEENARRLLEIGAPAERVHVSGNLKYDVKATGESAMTALIRERLPDRIADRAKVLVAGSTLDGEEAILLDAWRQVVADEPDAVLILAPRRTERFAATAALVEASGYAVIRASELRNRADRISAGGVVLLDTIGDLASVYSLGMAAFVGGSLVQAGGHNPLEPARFGVPVVMGPSSENFREIVDAMRAADAIRIVDAGGLASALTEMLKENGDARGMGERGHTVFNAQAGATARTAEALLGLLDRSAA
jgi:3-deoxy-D-manno-octulosonic-acid transferase